jgi:imidazolonepropionase-like amidohydrolase
VEGKVSAFHIIEQEQPVKMHRSVLYVLVLIFPALIHGCGRQRKVDLAIIHADVFDVHSGQLQTDRTILVKDGKILSVQKGSSAVNATQIIDAKRKLVTPGFIDTHIHPTDVFGDADQAPEYLAADSLDLYRKRLSDQYLPYGVTTVLSMGQPEKWLPPLAQWQKNPDPEWVDVLVAGGALISAENRKPYIAHTTVNNEREARQKVLDYHAMGLRHVKLYWRLRKPEFEAAFHTADSLGMKIYGHIDQNILFMDSTLAIGLKNYEHLLTIDLNVLHLQKDGAELGQQIFEQYGPSATNFPLVRLEMLRMVFDKKKPELDALLSNMAGARASVSTTIHLMAEPFGLTFFVNGRDSSLTEAHKARGRENFALLMRLARSMADKGILLRMGTDCPQGGKAMVSEQLLLAAHGFTATEILQISTLNGARAMGIEQAVGSLDKGKKAHMIIWESSPLVDPKYFSSAKTVIKDGRVVH